MPITYRIFPGSDMTYAAWNGAVCVEEVVENFQNYLSDPLYRPGRPELLDLSGMESADLRFPDLARLLGQVNAQPFPEITGAVTSVYAPGEVAWGLSRMYGTMAGLQSRIVVHLSRTETGALEALGRAEGSVAEFLHALEAAEHRTSPLCKAAAG